MRPQHGKAEAGRLIRDTCRRRSLSFLLAIPYATFHVIRRRDLVGAYFSSYSSSGSSSSSSSAVSALQRDPLDPAWADRGVRRPVCCAFVEISSLSSPHVNMSISNHSTTRKSWRSDAPIILPGWECHTGGSRSKPTVHRCRPKTGGCGLLTRTQDEPTKQHGSGASVAVPPEFSSDKMIGDNKILKARCRWSRTVLVPAECQISDYCVQSH